MFSLTTPRRVQQPVEGKQREACKVNSSSRSKEWENKLGVPIRESKANKILD